jgi:2',3'-cyclic-nucleotide 2'-phosphodiesterase (5'-nucleotidase family)
VAVLRGEDDGLRGEVVSGGTLTERMSSPDGAELVLLFGGETRGDLAPCGCEDRPAGGLARVAAHVAGVRATGAPALLLDAGAFLGDTQGFEGELRPDVAVGNAWVRDGLAQVGLDVANVTPVDLPGVRGDEGAVLPGVSANLRAEGLETARVVDVQGLRVGVTGVSAVPSVLPAGATMLPPNRGLKPVLVELQAQADIVVLLAWNAPEAARAAARAGLVDVVIDAQGHTGRHPPVRVGDAVWVRSPAKTERLGELRLQIEHGRVVGAVDRRIDLGPGAPEDADVRTLAGLAAEDIERVRASVFAPVVRSPR